MTKRSRPTSFDIAFRAGVSQATVSRVLRGSPLVNEDTRRRVEAVARELDYRVDRRASSLRTQTAATLALLLFEEPTPAASPINPFFLSMLGAITRTSAHHGQDLLVSLQRLSADWRSDHHASRRADGLILLGYSDHQTHRDGLAALVDAGAHFVRWGTAAGDPPGITIGSDNVEGGRLATRHLLEDGRRRIAFVGTASTAHPEFLDRRRGYEAALADAGLPVDPALQAVAASTEEAGHAAVVALLARGAPFDAVFAASDLIAIGAMHALHAAGRRVPQDVAVVGFDDIPNARYAGPPLTTVAQDTTQAAERLVATLMQRIRGEPAGNAVLPVSLVVRSSSRAS